METFCVEFYRAEHEVRSASLGGFSDQDSASNLHGNLNGSLKLSTLYMRLLFPFFALDLANACLLIFRSSWFSSCCAIKTRDFLWVLFNHILKSSFMPIPSLAESSDFNMQWFMCSLLATIGLHSTLCDLCYFDNTI